MSDIRLYVFKTGDLHSTIGAIKMNQGKDPFNFPVPWFLITHPKGNVVIDGGNPKEVIEDARGYWGNIVDAYRPVMDSTEHCVAQAASVGVEARDVRYVLQSHLHLDHTGAVGRFPNATHVVQRSEYEYAYAPDWFSAAAYIRRDFDRPGLKWQMQEGRTQDDYDLFGDGVIRTIFTPGHAVGHQSFLITLPNSGPILLTCDATYTNDHWEEKALPGFMVSAMDTVRSVQKLRVIADQTNAQVIVGHDGAGFDTLKHAPSAYYD
jgi:glyoxylase-like metal-dependent hydrolase (beta-lactamase superfamily II)